MISLDTLGTSVYTEYGIGIYLFGAIKQEDSKYIHYVYITQEDSKYFRQIITTENVSEYVNVCWRCKKELKASINETCNICHWLICDQCGACGDGHKRRRNLSFSHHLYNKYDLVFVSGDPEFVFYPLPIYSINKNLSNGTYFVNEKFIQAFEILVNHEIPFCLGKEQQTTESVPRLMIYWGASRETFINSAITILLKNKLITIDDIPASYSEKYWIILEYLLDMKPSSGYKPLIVSDETPTYIPARLGVLACCNDNFKESYNDNFWESDIGKLINYCNGDECDDW